MADSFSEEQKPHTTKAAKESNIIALFNEENRPNGRFSKFLCGFLAILSFSAVHSYGDVRSKCLLHLTDSVLVNDKILRRKFL